MNRWVRRLLAVPCLVVGACVNGDLTVPNFGNPTPGAIASDPSVDIQTRTNGILNLARRNMSWNNTAGLFGRESFSYGTDSRSTTSYLFAPKVDPGGLAAGDWNGFYATLRAIREFVAVIDSQPAGVLTSAQRSAAKGFAHTIEAHQLSILLSSRDTIGIPVEIVADPNGIAPFISRDSAYNYIAGRLDLAKTELLAGGSAFPFTLNAGFTGLTTPATFLTFNRGLAARINVYRASLANSGCGAQLSPACYTTALQNLAESFLAGTNPLTFGAYWVYSAAANDVVNPLNMVTNTTLVLHPSIGPDSPRRADGTFDLRYQAKVRRLSAPRNLGSGGLSIPTDYALSMYPTQASPAVILKNEELYLLRAEARYFTGDVAGALADINFIRVNSGGLQPIAGFADQNAFLSELLLQRRYSLLLEGHRWVDVRRFGRLNTLPIDIPILHFIAKVQPVPLAECQARVKSTFLCPP